MKKYSFNLFVLWLIVLSFLPVQAFAKKGAVESKVTFSQAELDQMLANWGATEFLKDPNLNK